jgi:diguanylate cyclase (GGDEF)-like protein/PAS domain S-box-containing protein
VEHERAVTGPGASGGADAEATATLLATSIDAGGFGFLLLNGSGQLIAANEPARRLLGFDAREVLGTEVGDLFHVDDRGWSVAELELLATGAIGRVRQQVRLRQDGDSERWVEINARRVPTEPEHTAPIIVLLEDAADRQMREQELRRLADTDPLTGLYNRRRFAAELQRHLRHGERYGARGALLLIDIDGLKQINDRSGHAAGDRAILATAGLLRSRLRVSDIVARVGGDEFAVMLAEADPEQSEAVAASLAGAEYTASERAEVPTLSIGVAPLRGPDPELAMKRADAAMYIAKRRGGNGYSALAEQPVEDDVAPEVQSSSEQPSADRPSATAIPLAILLSTIADLQSASPGLVEWELYAARGTSAGAWTLAIQHRLIEKSYYDTAEHEWLYRLSEQGRTRLVELRRSASS